MPHTHPHVTLGVSGGIAGYKSCILARRLVERGVAVDVVLTRAAGEFVRPLLFEGLTGRPVLGSLWERTPALAHLDLAKQSDLVIVAPATAHLLARATMGLADDLLTTILVARTGPVLAAPAMNDVMYAHPVTQANVAALGARGWTFVGPERGALAEGPSELPGRMSEPEAIVAAALHLLAPPGPLKGKKVLITAGPTREHLDPVRVITNPSSGRMGFALAEAAHARGADVTLITGPTELALPAGVRAQRVETTSDMERAVHVSGADVDVLIMAAAPADFRPTTPAATKRPRANGHVTLELESTSDILSTYSRTQRRVIVVGFALETGGDGVARAQEKLNSKSLDLVVLNDALEPGAGFEVTTNRVTIVRKRGAPLALPLASKRDVAERILDEVESVLS